MFGIDLIFVFLLAFSIGHITVSIRSIDRNMDKMQDRIVEIEEKMQNLEDID